MSGFILRDQSGLEVRLRFGEKEPKATGGGPVIARVNRPRKQSLTEWTGQAELGLQLSFKISSRESMDSREVENKMNVLQRFWGDGPGDFEPPQLLVIGDPAGCVPHDFRRRPSVRWFLEDIQEDDGTERNDRGGLIHISGTLILTQANEDKRLDRLQASKHKTAVRPKTYTVKKGDTLAKIAVREHIKGGWKTLAKLNDIRDPKRLKVGQKIRLS